MTFHCRDKIVEREEKGDGWSATGSLRGAFAKDCSGTCTDPGECYRAALAEMEAQ